MKIIDLLNPNGMDLDAHVKNKAEAIDRLADLMASTGVLADVASTKRGC